MSNLYPLKLRSLPQTLSQEEVVKIELVEGLPILRASHKVQKRIEVLLLKQQESFLNSEEERELNDYEELDDYLSLVNRKIRDIYI